MQFREAIEFNLINNNSIVSAARPATITKSLFLVNPVLVLTIILTITQPLKLNIRALIMLVINRLKRP